MIDTYEEVEDKDSLIDPIYRRFVRGVSRAIGSTEFYEFFMSAVATAQNEFQFSNRRMIKKIDILWVQEIEEALDAMQNIIATPRNVIKEEELIVNVANARKAGAETVRHLAGHSALVEDFNLDSGDVRPSKLMQRYREDTIGLYENRLVYTTIEYAHHFVKTRHDALLEEMGDEFGAKLKVKTDMINATEQLHMDLFLHVKEIDSVLETDKKHGDVLNRISRMYRVLTSYMNSDFSQEMSKLPRVSGTINKTNVLKKNPNYKKVLKLWEFLKNYQDVGYSIRIVEQNPDISKRFEEDIYRNILFNYLILKGYMEDEKGRTIPVPLSGKQEMFKPKIIHEIIEEMTQDYSLPDVEIRKILIEELTREQLMQEEAAERLRLVEEQEMKRNAVELQERAEQRAEKERLRQLKAAEAEMEEERLKKRNVEDQKRKDLFMEEIDYFRINLAEQIEIRRKNEALWHQEKDDFANAAALMEEEELRRKAMEYLQNYATELKCFAQNLDKRIKLRAQEEERRRVEIENRERARRDRLAKKNLEKE